MQPEYESLYNAYQDINSDPYVRTVLRNFLNSYKRGDISIALSNKLNLEELCPIKSKQENKVTFNDKLFICLVDNDTPICNNSIYKNLPSIQQKICLMCISEKESKLLK